MKCHVRSNNVGGIRAAIFVLLLLLLSIENAMSFHPLTSLMVPSTTQTTTTTMQKKSAIHPTTAPLTRNLQRNNRWKAPPPPQSMKTSSSSLEMGPSNSNDNPSPSNSVISQTINNNNSSAILSSSSTGILKMATCLSILTGIFGSILYNRTFLLEWFRYIKDVWLVSSLEQLNAAGPLGLGLYAILFWIWEMTLGITTPVEVAAGMAFGAQRATMASLIGKLGGAWCSFVLARFRYFDKVQSRLVESNELLLLMKERIQETPFQIALLCRFAPLPELVKNAGMGVLPVPQRIFVASVLLHGGFFTFLWSCMGAETAQMVLYGRPPSSTLKGILTGATWLGLGAPVLIGLWIKKLREDAQASSARRKEMVSTTVSPRP